MVILIIVKDNSFINFSFSPHSHNLRQYYCKFIGEEMRPGRA